MYMGGFSLLEVIAKNYQYTKENAITFYSNIFTESLPNKPNSTAKLPKNERKTRIMKANCAKFRNIRNSLNYSKMRLARLWKQVRDTASDNELFEDEDF